MKRYIVTLLSLNPFLQVSAPKLTDNKPLYEVLTQQSNGGANIRFSKFYQNQTK
jgi:hypothetical protein